MREFARGLERAREHFRGPAVQLYLCLRIPMKSRLVPPLALATFALTASAAPNAATDLPVREIALFSSGVGYFQHEGPVRDNARAELQFKTEQINDLLKSLVLMDLNGGTIGAVTYPSLDPIEKTLRSFQVDITGNPSLGDLLNQLRGAKITFTWGTEKQPGTVLGVEIREVSSGEKSTPLKAAFLNVITAAGIRSLPISELRALQFDDPALQAELEKALTALSAARDKDKKTVGLAFNGKGDRTVRLGYVVETPVWKTTYRLVFGAKADGKPMLQGWALVENQTENDWNDVKLSLVSGRPISFVQDLYQPLYVQRPIVQNEVRAGVAPQRYEAGFNVLQGAPKEMPATRMAIGGMSRGLDKARSEIAARKVPAGAPATPAPEDAQPFDATASVVASAVAGEVGELFQYTVSGVSLPRQRSAMIPIVNDLIHAEKLSIFNRATNPKFPLNGARLTNSTDLHFLAGPVTVFDEGRYAGDARIGDVPPGQTRLLSYGMDLQLPVMVENERSSRRITAGKIVGGVLELSRKLVSSRTYAAENKSKRDKKIVVEHPRSGADWKLVDSAQPGETTESLYRFDFRVEAGKTERIDVKEERVESERIALVNAAEGNILAFVQEGEFPAPVREALNKAARFQRAIVDSEHEIEARGAQIESITTEQERLRENVKTAGERSEYGVRLLRKLNEQETQIEKLQAETNSLRKKQEAQRKELADYLKDLSVG